MGVDTTARLLGNISPEEIADFIKNRFGWRVKLGISSSHLEIGVLKPFANYTGSPTWDTKSGFIDLLVNASGSSNRSLFYCKSNLNFRENYDYYEENYPELLEMVCSETTYLSLHHDAQAIEIISAIVNEFGGWFCENDCSGEYCRVIGIREMHENFVFVKLSPKES